MAEHRRGARAPEEVGSGELRAHALVFVFDHAAQQRSTLEKKDDVD